MKLFYCYLKDIFKKKMHLLECYSQLNSTVVLIWGKTLILHIWKPNVVPQTKIKSILNGWLHSIRHLLFKFLHSPSFFLLFADCRMLDTQANKDALSVIREDTFLMQPVEIFFIAGEWLLFTISQWVYSLPNAYCLYIIKACTVCIRFFHTYCLWFSK